MAVSISTMVRRRRSKATRISATADRSPETAASAARWDTFATFDDRWDCRFVAAAANLQSHLSSNVANVSQRAALAAVSGALSAVAEMRVAFDRRRRTIVEMLTAIDGVVCPMPKGAFYAYPSVEGVLGKTIRGRTPRTSAELAALILE